MGYILVNGCSWTDKNFNPNDQDYLPLDHRFKMWPEVLGEMMNLDVVNLGFVGQGNRGIIGRSLDHLVHNKDKPEYLIIQLSGWDRFDFIGSGHYVHTLNLLGFHTRLLRLDKDDSRDLKHIKKIRKVMMGEEWTTFDPIVKYILRNGRFKFQNIFNNTLRDLYGLIYYCRCNNIKLVVWQGINPFVIQGIIADIKELGMPKGLKMVPQEMIYGLSYVKLVRELQQNKYFHSITKLIDDDEFTAIGWPFFNGVGYNVTDYVYEKSGLTREEIEEKYWCTPIDPHPSNFMHEQMAKHIYENICS